MLTSSTQQRMALPHSPLAASSITCQPALLTPTASSAAAFSAAAAADTVHGLGHFATYLLCPFPPSTQLLACVRPADPAPPPPLTAP
jgi:hypothetical protein